MKKIRTIRRNTWKKVRKILKKSAKYQYLILAVYSIVLIFLSSLITYNLTKVETKPKRLPILFSTKSAKSVLGAQDSEYLEKNSSESAQTVENPDIILYGSRDEKKIALTFDAEMTDGMKENLLSGKTKSSFDSRIIDTLNQTNTKATIFLTGMWIELYPAITKQLADNPLIELGSHSYADTSYDGYCFGLKQIQDKQKLEEIETTQKLLRDVAGIENRYFRFPGGCFSDKSVNIVVNVAGLKIIHWDVAGQDGFNYNANQIVRNVSEHLQNGSIIILHLNGEPTAPKTSEALPAIIADAKLKGFEFVKISELLNLPQQTKIRE